MAIDDGATADNVAKRLRLERSSAWRRLNKAVFKGFIVNLETRHRQPGRYRLTDQEVEAEELLPAPEAIEADCVGVRPRGGGLSGRRRRNLRRACRDP